MQNYLYESKITIYQILKSLRDIGINTRGWAWWKSSSGETAGSSRAPCASWETLRRSQMEEMARECEKEALFSEICPAVHARLPLERIAEVFKKGCWSKHCGYQVCLFTSTHLRFCKKAERLQLWGAEMGARGVTEQMGQTQLSLFSDRLGC